jgi:DNA-binding HxlR family transcriptional regulator
MSRKTARQSLQSSRRATVPAVGRAQPVLSKAVDVASRTSSGDKKASPSKETLRAAQMVEDVIGCKWSLQVLDLVRRGVNRPGAMSRAVPGLTPKVLSQRLEKFVRFGIFMRMAYAEIPPRVEYELTPFGRQFLTIVDAVERLQDALTREDHIKR